MILVKLTIAALFFGAAMSASFAAESLFDFSDSDCGWKSTNKRNVLKRSAEYPVEGKQGLFFTGPAWKGGSSIWPSFETRSLPIKDWSKYDRLVVSVFNDSAAEMKFGIYLSHSNKPIQVGGVHFDYKLAPYSSKQLVLKLKQSFRERGINPADISLIHCFTENPEKAMRFFVDGFTLLEPSDPVPDLPERYRQKILNRQASFLAPRLKQMEAEAAALDFSSLPPDMANRLQERVNALLARFRCGNDNELLLSLKGTPPEWRAIPSIVSAISSFEVLRKDVSTAPGYENVLLGYATSMEKVLPRAPLFRALPKCITIETAQNEKEAAQLIVMPLGKARKKVSVKLTTFTGPAGTLPNSALSAVPVGFVETTFIPPSGSDYVGFWPDPLLAFLNTVDVEADEAQSFWIKADIPAGQPAGVYSGKAEITIDDETAFSVPISVRVRNFSLPNRPLLPLGITFWPASHLIRYCNPGFDPEALKSPAAPVHAWKKHKKAWSDMLASYGLKINSLYEHPDYEPDLDLLAELDREGKLGTFNLGYFGPASDNPANNYGMQSTIDRIRPRYEKAKKLGILKHAFIYGCDETRSTMLPLAERAAAILKKEFPDVPISTTAGDESYGTDGRLGSIDIFCPLTRFYNEKQATAARKAGKKVFWYVCFYPTRPYANMFIEGYGIEPRLLMGAMTAKYRPDGFLYYQISQWNNTAPITAGPYTDWVAQSYPNANGDGNWTYPGPDSTPLGSIRLENFRDGLEDYSYVKILEQRLAVVKQAGQNPQWQSKAQAALRVPAALVGSLTEYTRDPQKVYAWRSRLADLIEAAPIK